MATSADVLVALRNWWDAQPWAGNYSGPYRNLADSDRGQPRWIVTILDANQSHRTNKTLYWDVALQLMLFHSTDTAVEAGMTEVGDALDAAELTLTTGDVLRLDRVNEHLPSDSGESKRECRGGFDYVFVRSKGRLDR